MKRSRWELFGESTAVNAMMIASMAIITAVFALMAQETGLIAVLP